jgi:hypothetical protein
MAFKYAKALLANPTVAASFTCFSATTGAKGKDAATFCRDCRNHRVAPGFVKASTKSRPTLRPFRHCARDLLHCSHQARQVLGSDQRSEVTQPPPFQTQEQSSWGCVQARRADPQWRRKRTVTQPFRPLIRSGAAKTPNWPRRRTMAFVSKSSALQTCRILNPESDVMLRGATRTPPPASSLSPPKGQE